jgi:uncharacterized protein (TIGR02145 family)
MVGNYTNIFGQRLKHIHQKSKPTRNVPTHLIEKIETGIVSGEKLLIVTQVNGHVIQIPISEIDSITHSQGQAVDPSLLGELRTTNVYGIVKDENGLPVHMAIVKSAFGTEQTMTDSNGVFFLNNIIVYDKLGFITVEKTGYFRGSRSFLPLASGASNLSIRLIPLTLAGIIVNSEAGVINSGNLQLTFPAYAVQQNGQLYSGAVNVYAHTLNPSEISMSDQMPGELVGCINDSLRILASYGMVVVELRNDSNELLQLDSGITVSIRLDIPNDLESSAPDNIDWWSFDETVGYWKHEGVAQKQGNYYIGEASHFSWWNYDIQTPMVELQGSVNDNLGNPVSNAFIQLVTQSNGSFYTYSNAEGEFGMWLPQNQTMTMNIKLLCGITNSWITTNSQTIVSGTSAINADFTATLENQYLITGTLVNCAGNAVSSGYVFLNSHVYFANSGQINISICDTGTITLRGFDISNPDSIKASDYIQFQIGSLGANLGYIAACTTIFGNVTDIDGNIYPTVLIGNKWWMAKDLKTTRFSQGSVIPNVTLNGSWVQLNTPGWCNYDNNALNDSIYGKLYNFYTVADSRNVCPTGWHVPSDQEFTTLTDFLGGIGVAGGKLKSTIGWTSPNSGASNQSFFNALPNGSRKSNTGGYVSSGLYGSFWTSTTEDLGLSAWDRYLSYDNTSVGRLNVTMKSGLAVRCVKN